MNKITIYDEEMEKLERQQRELRDQHNEKEHAEWNGFEYVRALTTGKHLPYAIQSKEQFKDYMIRLSEHVKLQTKENADRHIFNNGRGCWYTHKERNGQPCFMCKDVDLISYQNRLLEYFAHKYPKETIQI